MSKPKGLRAKDSLKGFCGPDIEKINVLHKFLKDKGFDVCNVSSKLIPGDQNYSCGVVNMSVRSPKDKNINNFYKIVDNLLRKPNVEDIAEYPIQLRMGIKYEGIPINLFYFKG